MTTKFIYLRSLATEEEVDKKVEKLSEVYIEILKDLYKRIRFCEFVDENNYKCMYAITDEKDLQKLCQQYVNLDIKFSFTDISRTVLFNQPFLCESLIGTDKEQIEKLCKEYIDANLDVNTVLEKISELGSEHLTKQDKEILNPKNI